MDRETAVNNLAWRRLQPATFDRNASGGYDVVIHVDVIAALLLLCVVIAAVIA